MLQFLDKAEKINGVEKRVCDSIDVTVNPIEVIFSFTWIHKPPPKHYQNTTLNREFRISTKLIQII